MTSIVPRSLQDALPALKFSGAKMAGLHFIEEQEQIVLVAKLSRIRADIPGWRR